MTDILAQASGGQGGSALSLLVPLVLMGGLFYFLLIRPQQRRSRAQRDLIASVAVGDEIMTAGGIIGTVTAIDEDEDVLTVEIAPNTNIRVVKRAVSQRFVEDAGGGAADEDYEDEDDVEDERPAGDASVDAADDAGDDSTR
jgi:preprotein translocase subunit YajC